MPITDRRDWLLRMMEQLAQTLAGVRHSRQEGELETALREMEGAYGALLGPVGDVARRLDAATAAQVVGDADRVGVLARLLAEHATLYRAAGDAAVAEEMERRALAVAREAWGRGPKQPEPVRELMAELEGGADGRIL